MVEIANTTREKPTVNMKNSSMNMAPNGRIPAISVLSTQTYQDNVAEETYTAQRQSLISAKHSQQPSQPITMFTLTKLRSKTTQTRKLCYRKDDRAMHAI